MTDEIPIQCVLDAIPENERDAQVARSREIFGAVQSVDENADGYTFILPLDLLPTVATWVSYEHLCCPFFEFTIRLAPSATKLEFSLSGGDTVKAFIAHEIVGELVNIAS